MKLVIHVGFKFCALLFVSLLLASCNYYEDKQPSSTVDFPTGRMPKGDAPLSADLRGALAGWVAAGAPKSRDVSSPPPPPTELRPNWISISEKIVFPKCVACHNSQGQAKFLDLSDRQLIFNSRDRVFSSGSKLIDFDSAESSYLIQILKDEIEPMPPVSSRIDRLTDAEIDVIREWIRLGLP